MRPKPVVPVKLPAFDYEGYAARLARQCRESGVSREIVAAAADAYAKMVRDQDVALAAARIVGQACQVLRENCAVPDEIISRWAEEAVARFPSGAELTDRKLARFFTPMFHEMNAAQWAEGLREAREQAAGTGDATLAEKWKRAAFELDAGWRSI